jgi:hypothetical protein
MARIDRDLAVLDQAHVVDVTEVLNSAFAPRPLAVWTEEASLQRLVVLVSFVYWLCGNLQKFEYFSFALDLLRGRK